ncbi:MAG TPA: preprotein translocase subunit SecA, partial [Alphaproteobacteria bacterium]|nr:preprotein translocase subunit SecA [Alphaproteobacteria bacterium]
MIQSVLKKLFGSANERVIKKYKKRVQEISLIEPQLVGLSDEELSLRTPWLKSRLENGETLDDILVDAFATVREAAKRVFSQRHYDVQLIGGMVLHDGKIAEMRTGEGKTLVATLPVYLNALLGKGVHLVTINDYLAKRDSEWMGRVYRFLGLSVGCIVHGLTDRQRQENYSCDVTYGTNHEFGFDYLRDNMKFRLSDMVQRPFNYAIVDEVDSILVDEARTPLIISGSAEDSSELYQKINEFIPLLTDEDVEKDEKQKNVMLTEQGVEKIESLVIQAGLLKGESLYDVQNVSIVHHVNCALKAHKMFTRDVDYMVKDDKVMIIDEFTGRIMEGRRYSEGLHQALEAKEHVKIENENQTLASITYQNFFRLYPKLSGMTGTGATEATEFDEIYKLQVVEIPTNVPVQRIDHDDEVYLTEKDKFAAMIKEIKAAYEKKQPVLVGTASIEKSEVVSKLLTKEGIKHQVLNAKYHEQESYIVALAGRLGGITVATNMAGRGTDIKLGGNAELQIELELKDIPEGEERLKKEAEIKAQVVKDEQTVKELGGLYVIGTERHESRRIDNQLRGRSGRQGDPGVSKFFISLQDDLMRIFGSERLDSMLRRFGVQEGEVISHKMISKSLARAQQKVEARNFDIRKHLLKYDDVMNDQRKIIYEQRRFVMECDTLSPMMNDMREDVIDRLISIHIPTNSLIDEWDMQGLHMEAKRIFNLDLPFGDWVKEDTISEHAIKDRLLQATQEEALKKKQDFGEEMMASAEKTLLLRLLDQSWKD